MKNSYTAVVKKSGKWWIGWIEEIPGVNCQERTCKQLLETLRVMQREALELNGKDAGKVAGAGFLEDPVTS